MTHSRYVLFGVHTVLGLVTAAQLHAQEAQAVGTAQSTGATSRSDTSGQLQEVIVTAEKRAERLQDVPLSITAITANDLEDRSALGIGDLQYSVPGLSINQSQSGQAQIQIGGISNGNGEATVGVYLDEMAIDLDKTELGSGGSIPDIRLLDMARVEVLRGPQGTLYGEGAMGGAIHYVTASPDLTSDFVNVDVAGGSISNGAASYRASGVLNVPLVNDKLGMRIVAGYEKDGGWIDDAETGQSNINGIVYKTFRAKLLAEPVAGLELSLLALHQNADQDWANYGVNGQYNGIFPTYDHDRYDLENGVLRYDFGSFNVVESLGYLDRANALGYNLTYAFVPFLEAPPPLGFGLPPGYITEIPFALPATQRLWTNELRFASSGESRLQWTAGVFYRDSYARFDQKADTYPGTLPFTVLEIEEARTSKSFAIFGDATYKITSHLGASVGARYFQDREFADALTVEFGAPTAVPNKTATFRSTDPRFNLSYTFSPDSMVYANAAKGFRTGGFNVSSNAPGVPFTYQPDQLWTYTLGTKQQMLNQHLEVDGDGFYTDWKNVQSNYVVPNTNVGVITNTGKVSGWGTDLQVIYRPIAGLTLSGTFGWNNLAYVAGTRSTEVMPGDPVDLAVRRSYSASADYRVPIVGSTIGFVRIDYQHAGPAQQSELSLGGLVAHIPAHSLTNLRIGADFDRVEVALLATNLFNDRSAIFPAIPTFPWNSEQTPRAIWLDLSAHL